jgi:uncharacterized protein YndB with AHSA1/START domain
MSVISVEKDFDTLTMTLVAEFEVPIERVWELWADPRQLERWWGPPGHPAAFEEHDLTPGGAVTYAIAGPGGNAARGWWRITAADPPRLLEFTDGFAKQDGTPVADGPTTAIRVQLTDRGGRTRMEVRSVFSSREHMEQVVRLGAIEAFERSVGQIDALLAG